MLRLKQHSAHSNEDRCLQTNYHVRARSPRSGGSSVPALDDPTIRLTGDRRGYVNLARRTRSASAVDKKVVDAHHRQTRALRQCLSQPSLTCPGPAKDHYSTHVTNMQEIAVLGHHPAFAAERMARHALDHVASLCLLT
jgi:hypothetical protein